MKRNGKMGALTPPGTLRIGLDLVNLADAGEGLGRFARQLVEALAGAGPGPEFVLFVREEMAGHFAALSPRMRLAPVRLPRRRLLPWNQLAFLGRGRLDGLDILHSPVSVTPLVGAGQGPRRLVTVHDLAFLTSPTTSSALSKAWWRYAWPRSLARAARVVTVSEHTKRDVVSRFSIAEDKVTVIYSFVSFAAADVPADAVRRVRERFRLPRRYILHVGAMHKRKNIIGLVRAFKRLKKEAGLEHALVLAGPRGWDDASVLRETKEAGLVKDVVFTGFVADEDLPGVYAGADVFVFPSLYEGFGYPPLEAMACGTPAVVSNVSSLPEVVGEAALLVPPEDDAAMAKAVLEVLRSPGLAAKLREAGRRRVEMFSRERMARDYLRVYAEVAGRAEDGRLPSRRKE
jgi:glycosyltransferase involved in cell wall biosynthesis